MLTNRFDLFIGKCSNKIEIFPQSVPILTYLYLSPSIYVTFRNVFQAILSHMFFSSPYISSNNLSVLFFISLFFIFSRKNFPNLNTFLYTRYKTGANWPQRQRSRHASFLAFCLASTPRVSYEVEMLERPIRRPQTRIEPYLSVLQHSLDHHQQVSNIWCYSKTICQTSLYPWTDFYSSTWHLLIGTKFFGFRESVIS